MEMGWNKKNDKEKLQYLRDELQRKGTLNLVQWEHYNRLFKAADPKGFEEDQVAARKRIDMRNAKNNLTITELEQIITEKKELEAAGGEFFDELLGIKAKTL